MVLVCDWRALLSCVNGARVYIVYIYIYMTGYEKMGHPEKLSEMPFLVVLDSAFFLIFAPLNSFRWRSTGLTILDSCCWSAPSRREWLAVLVGMRTYKIISSLSAELPYLIIQAPLSFPSEAL